MAIDFEDPEIAAQEIERAEALANEHNSASDELIAGYHGSYYRAGHEPDEETPENSAYEYAALMLPLLCYDNPAVQVEVRKVTTDPMIAAGIEDALNGGIVEDDLQQLFELVAIDFLFSYGVLLTTFDSYGGSDQPDLPPLMAPKTHYVSNKRFFMDANAVARVLDGEGFDGLRFMGHKWVRDRETLLTMPGFDKEAVEELSTDVGLKELGRPTKQENPSRDEIVGYEIWVPPETCDPRALYNGTIYTIAAHQESKNAKGQAVHIRKPRPFYGPSWGPYAFFGAYPVPNECYPLAPIAAVAAQSMELNIHANAASRAAAREKKLTLIGDNNKAAGKATKSGKDGEVWNVPNLTDKTIVQVELGGVSPGQFEYLAALRERHDRNSGVNETRRGNISGNELATAITSSNNASSQRDSFLKKKFAQGAVRALMTRAWYLYHSPNVVRPLSPTASKRMGMKYPVFHGGVQPGQENQSFADLGLRIEPYSMERPNEGELQQKTLAVVNWLTGAAATMPQITWLDWNEMLSTIGKVFNLRSLQRLFIPQRLEQMRQAMAQASQAGNKPQTPPKTPAESLNYKDAPPDIQRQIEAQAGLQPSQIGVTNDQALEAVDKGLHHHAAGRMPPPLPPQARQPVKAGGGAK